MDGYSITVCYKMFLENHPACPPLSLAQEVVPIAGALAGWRQTILSTCLDQSHDYSTVVPSGKPTKKLWKDPPFSMGKSTISMAMFNSKLLNYQRVNE